jgi:hypothetical protein
MEIFTTNASCSDMTKRGCSRKLLKALHMLICLKSLFCTGGTPFMYTALIFKVIHHLLDEVQCDIIPF